MIAPSERSRRMALLGSHVDANGAFTLAHQWQQRRLALSRIDEVARCIRSVSVTLDEESSARHSTHPDKSECLDRSPGRYEIVPMPRLVAAGMNKFGPQKNVLPCLGWKVVAERVTLHSYLFEDAIHEM